MSEHTINGFMGISMEKIRSMVDADTMVGEPISCGDNTTIIPISKISLGFASGGSDLPTRTTKEYFAGGAGVGMSIKPVGFLVVHDGDVRMLPITAEADTGAALVSLIPGAIDKITGLFRKEKQTKQETTEQETETSAE